MEITAEEKVAAFSDELASIFDKKIREFTRLCVMQSPDYFYLDCPSSSSGKYHPLDELGADGVLIHTKKVFTMAYEMVKALACEHNRDLVLSACIIHDLRKQGLEKLGYTDMQSHNDWAADLVNEVQEATQLLTEEQHTIIRDCVGYPSLEVLILVYITSSGLTFTLKSFILAMILISFVYNESGYLFGHAS